jgi:hypothetical protein
MIRLFLATLLAGGLAVGCGGSDLPAGSGLVFHQPVLDLGERWAGESLHLEFPFSVVAEPVRVDTALPDCGCLGPELWVEGVRVALGSEIAAGSEGVLKVDFNTAGFRGRKFTGVDLGGDGPGLPVKVEIHSWLRSWFELQPQAVQFGVIDGVGERVATVEVRGQEPFRITEILSQSPPLSLRGVPSTVSSRRHVIEVVLPPSTEEGRHVGFFSLGTDKQGFSFRLAVSWEVAGELWTIPDKRLLLGELGSGVEHFYAIEVGARVGRLEPPEVELSDLPGGVARVEKVADGTRYRVHLRVIPESANIRGAVLLRLPYTVDGRSETIERRIQVFGVVRSQESNR